MLLTYGNFLPPESTFSFTWYSDGVYNVLTMHSGQQDSRLLSSPFLSYTWMTLSPCLQRTLPNDTQTEAVGEVMRGSVLSGTLLSSERWLSEVAQSCPTLCDPMGYSPPGSSVHGIFQAWILEWDAISFSRESSRPRDWTQVSRIIGRHFTVWATREAQELANPVTTMSPQTFWDWP